MYINFENLPDEKDFRFIAVLNKKIEIGKLMNALGHMTAGLVGKVEDANSMHFLNYIDGNNGIHQAISHFPYIVLEADNSNKIRSVRNEAINRKISFTDFTSTMTLGTSQQQVETTKETLEQDLEYFGIVLFGKSEELKQFTGKFSLFK